MEFGKINKVSTALEFEALFNEANTKYVVRLAKCNFFYTIKILGMQFLPQKVSLLAIQNLRQSSLVDQIQENILKNNKIPLKYANS